MKQKGVESKGSMPPPEPEEPPKALRAREAVAEEEALPSEPEVKTPEKEGEAGTKEDRFQRFIDGLEAVAKHGMPVQWAGAMIWKNIEKLHTPLGKFKEELAQHAVAPEGSAVPFDILPISLEGVEDMDSIKWPQHEWVLAMCLVLNYQYCAGFGSAKYLRHPRKLTAHQRELVVNHLLPAVCRFAPDDLEMVRSDEVKRELERKGHDGYGGTWVVMENLETEKVVACWPEATHAAVAPIEKFLTGETLEQIKRPMDSILPPEEWPKDIPKSYVRADDETWTALVKEGLARGLFQVCPEDEILTSPSGQKILNGAGGVPKVKGTEMKQRFISIFCPLNAVSKKLEGSEDTLPYVGQVGLVSVPQEAEILVDSEDMASAFNLFKMPEGWRGLFVYEKTVKAADVGVAGGGRVYISLNTIPMGWLSAVGVVQSAIRYLAFEIAGLPQEKEVRKWRELPSEEKFLLYLDSVDQLRVVSKTMAKVLEGQPSEEHQAFSEACDRMGLPRNQSKALAGALHGSLQGGELRSQEGIFMLQPEKMQMNIAMAYFMLTQEKWAMRETTGLVGRLVFAAAFRRPLLAVMEELFTLFTKGGPPKKPPAKAVDEMISMLVLMPLAFGNLKAPVGQALHATDASPTGAGSCISLKLKRAQGSPNPNDLLCTTCRKEIGELIATAEEFDCPRGCGQRSCSVACHLKHQVRCDFKETSTPMVSERWSGPNFPLTQAMLREGLEVASPYDIQVDWDCDYFSEEGKRKWDELDGLDIAYEHHAPDCKTMSRSRGRPFEVDGVWMDGPPALRDARNVMGFSHLKGNNAVRVRQGNKMALRSVKRCSELHARGRFFSLEHPWRSWLWYMAPVVALAEQDGVFMAYFSNCCHGGRREKWTALLTNSKELYNALHKEECEHTHEEADYQPYYDEQGILRFPTEEEAEYPREMCAKMAQAVQRELVGAGLLVVAKEEQQVQAVAQQLEKYHRMQNPELKEAIARRVVELERPLVEGNEAEALAQLLRNGHYRGTDVRLFVDFNDRKELVPYPAYRWLWRDVLSFRWKHTGHINELEAQAFVAHVKRILRQASNFNSRHMIVVDSQVLYFALGKGRSPSRRLNRILKRVTALALMTDTYFFPVWTLSAWNHADNPSRRAG